MNYIVILLPSLFIFVAGIVRANPTLTTPITVITKRFQPQSNIYVYSPLKFCKMSCEPNIIIIADDDADDSLFLLRALLTVKIELTVIIVPNGQRLIDVLESVSPKYIFLDINMPKRNGFDALKQIRLNKILDQPTVIMCSTSGSLDEVKLSQELGANLYLKKPNNMKNMNRMIEDVLSVDWSDKDKKNGPKQFMIDSDKQYA